MFSFDHHLEQTSARQMGQPALAQAQRQMSDQLVPYKGDMPFHEPGECQFADAWVGEIQAQG